MKKRFIAGAVCPKCGASDAIRLYLPEGNEADHQVRDCVDCGYQESLAQHLAVRQELNTRVNHSPTKEASEIDSTEAQPLQFIP